MNVLAITHHSGIRLAELGFLLGAVAGALLALAGIAPGSRMWTFVGGVVLAAGSVLLIIASHWGHFG